MHIKTTLNKPWTGIICDGQFLGKTIEYVTHAKTTEQALQQIKAISKYHKCLLSNRADKYCASLLTVKQLQEEFNISERTSRRLRSTGKLPFIIRERNVLFDRKSVVDFLESRKG